MATLAAAIIVGKEESFELRRLLESIQGPLFDQICVTTTQGDPDVEAVARELATTVSSFTWVNDFSAARNFSFQQATTTHIMWLDSDDVLKSDNYQKLLDLKSKLDDVDMVVMSYAYGHDEADAPTTVLPRERLVRNDQAKVKWHDPIHEYLNMDGGMKIIERRDIFVDHYRIKPFNAERNLSIHKRVWDAGDMSPRQMFYYAKDLLDSNQGEESIPVFEKYLAGPTDFADNKAVACIRMAHFYRDAKSDPETSASYLRKGLMYSTAYAEFPFFLGMYYKESRNDTDTAISYLLQAAGKPLAAGMSMQAEYYEYLPCKQLAFMYYDKGDLDKSLHYCERALKANPKDPHCAHNIEVIKAALAAKGARPPVAPTTRKLMWFVPYFSPVDPSQRIRRLNVHRQMEESSLPSKLVTNYLDVPQTVIDNSISSADVVILSSYTPRDMAIVESARTLGKKSVLDFNEAIMDNEAVMKMIQAVDMVVCCSTKLAELVAPMAKAVTVIPDAIELLLPPGTNHQYIRPDREKPVALYIGMGGNSFLVKDHLRAAIEGAGYVLKVCTEWEDADVKWDLETWPSVMSEADVILCPQRVDVQPAKSNVKVTQAMALGIPVIASKLQSYKEVIRDGWNGYLVTGRDEWGSALTALKNDYKRIQIGMNAAMTVDAYKLPSIVDMWEKAADQLCIGEVKAQDAKTAPSTQLVVQEGVTRETIPILIPVYNGLEYLKQCLSSIQMNTTYPYSIVLSDAGSGEETWSYLRALKGITVIGEQGKRKNFSEACNDAILATSGRFFVILNSDVIVSKGWLEPLVEQMTSGGRIAACGVLSNCDRGWLHGAEGRPQYPMRLHAAGMELVPGMKIDQVTPHLDELDQFMSWSNNQHKGQYVEQPWVAYYATIIARSVVDEAGLLDTNFKNGCEDLDHCRRLALKGYKMGQRLDSFVYHYGGISRSAYEVEGMETYHAEDRTNHEYYARKWSKKRIAIYTGQGWEKWNRNTVDSGMAGSETWAAELAAEFSRMGFDTHLFNDCPVEGEVDRDGVTYHMHNTYPEWSKFLHVDYLILSRTCDPAKIWHLRSGRTSVMIHDVWLSPDASYDTRQWAMQDFGCLSDWHMDFAGRYHKLDSNKLFLTANGVREELYADVVVSTKKNRAVYSSSPDRGLHQLLLMVPKIREVVPDFELDVAYGYHNWESAAKLRNNPNEIAMIEEIKRLTAQPGVNYLGRIDKKTLATRQKEAKLWLYPTWFSETFGITAVEAGMARNAVVTTPFAGLLTTLGDSAIYIKGPANLPVEHWSFTAEYQESFLAETIKLLTDEPYRQACADKVHAKTKGYTWRAAAEGWLKRWGTQP